MMPMRPSFLQNFFFKRRLRKCKLVFPIACKIHSVTKSDRQGALAQSRTGDKLQLVHSAVENYPFNVYVYSIPLNRVLGYLDPVLAEKLVYLFRRGFCIDGVIEEVTGGAPYPYFGCNIRILQSADFLRAQTDFSHLYG